MYRAASPIMSPGYLQPSTRAIYEPEKRQYLPYPVDHQNFQQSVSPYAQEHQPPVSQVPIDEQSRRRYRRRLPSLDPLLATGSQKMLVFDLSDPDFGPMQYSKSEPDRLEFLPIGELDGAAVLPPTTQMDIVCSGPAGDWLIELRLLNTKGLVGRAPPPITIGDVLVMIHQYLAQPIEEAVFSGINPDYSDRIRRAQQRRCAFKLPGDQAEEEKKERPKKIDSFANNVWFGGLKHEASTPEGIEVYRLSMCSGDERFLF